MKSTKLITAALLATLALAACNKEDDAPTGGLQPGQVNIATSIGGTDTGTPGSRAPQLDADGSGSFATGDELGLYAYVGGEAKLTNSSYKVNETALYWDELSTTAPVTFAAYYPRTATVTDPAAYVFNAATATDGDLLVATPVTKSKDEAVALNFRHAMHRLIVNMTTDVDGLDLTLAIVRLTGMNAAVAVNITTGTVTAGEANEPDETYEPVRRYKTPGTTAGVTAEFVVAPQKVVTDADWIQITAGGKQYTYKIPAQIKNAAGAATELKELESGKTLTLNLAITRDAVTLTVGDIAPWDTQGKIDHEIDHGSGIVTASTIATLQAAIDAATGTAANPTLIRLGADIDIPTAGGEFGNVPTFSLGDQFDNAAPARHIRIDGAGHSLIAKENGSRMIGVYNGSTLTLANIRLDGNNTATAYSIVTAASASTITLGDGAVLQNLNNENWGDGTVFPSVGVSLVGASTLVMNSGASIKDVEGHAIRSEDNSDNQIRLNGGSISGSRADIFVSVAMSAAIIRIAALPTVDGGGKMKVISGYITFGGGTSPLIAPEGGSTALSLDDFTFTILDSNTIKDDITAQCDIFLDVADGIIKIKKKE